MKLELNAFLALCARVPDPAIASGEVEIGPTCGTYLSGASFARLAQPPQPTPSGRYRRPEKTYIASTNV